MIHCPAHGGSGLVSKSQSATFSAIVVCLHKDAALLLVYYSDTYCLLKIYYISTEMKRQNRNVTVNWSNIILIQIEQIQKKVFKL